MRGRKIVTVSLDLLAMWLQCSGNVPGRVTSTDAPSDMKVLAVYMKQSTSGRTSFSVQTSFEVVVDSEEWDTVPEHQELPQFTPFYTDEDAHTVSTPEVAHA